MGLEQSHRKTPGAYRRLDGSAIQELVFGGPDVDPRTSAARLGGLLYILSGLVVVVTVWLPQPDPISRPLLLTLGAMALVSGLVIPRIPWERWPLRAQLIVVILAFLLIAAGNVGFDAQLNAYHVMYVTSFAFLGLTQPPGTSLLLLPLAVASYAIPGVLIGDPGATLTATAIMAPVWAVVGEVLAHSTSFLRRAEQGAERLLDASTTLTRAVTEDEVAHKLARLAADLLHASSSVVFLPADADGTFSNRGQHDFAVTPNALTINVRKLGWMDDAAFREGLPLLVPDTASDLLPHSVRDGLTSVSAALMPLLGDEALLGCLLVGWQHRRSRLDRFDRRAAELLCSEAARAVDRVRTTNRLAFDAETDELTGLPNRRSYDRALEQLAPGDAVVFVDLDHFKNVNDEHGHLFGDDVLRTLARCMRRIARKSDCVARYGGEEFAMVLASAGERGALAALRRLKALWEETDPITTFSGGVAVHVDAETPTDALMRADIALYRAKQNGRNRVEVARPAASDAEAAPSDQLD